MQGAQDLRSWGWGEDVPGKASVCTVPRTPSQAHVAGWSGGCLKSKGGGQGRKGAFRACGRASEFRSRRRPLCCGDLGDELFRLGFWVSNPRNQFQITAAKRRIGQEGMMQLAEVEEKLTDQGPGKPGTRTSRRSEEQGVMDGQCVRQVLP